MPSQPLRGLSAGYVAISLGWVTTAYSQVPIPERSKHYADAILILRFCYSEVVGIRKRQSAGGNILPMMLNLNGQHAHVDP
jgi:hypothetical protein